MTESVQAGVGTAHLSSELDEEGPYVIHGVALGAGDVTIGSSGIKKRWPAEELEQAAESLEGKPLVKDHENNTDGTVGTVTRATYREGVGVLYEAEIAPHYEQLAKDVSAGILEVSARAYHDPVEELDEDDDTGALEVQNIKFDNLAVVSQGASPSNTVQIGEAATMAQGPDGGTVAVMEQGAPRMDAAELAEAFHDDREDIEDDESEDELDSVEEIDELNAGVLKFYGPVSSMVDEDEIESLVDDLSQHDAIDATLVGDAHDHKIIAIVDTTSVDNVDDLNDHIVETLDDTPFEVWEDYSWIDEVVRNDHLESFEFGDEAELSDVLDEIVTDDDSDSDSEELESAWHTPEWDGLDDSREWSKPSMEDFDTDDLSEIDDHFFVSKTGEWPPENYSDLALPAVWPNGDLSLDGLDSVHQMASQTDGVSDDMADSIKSKANELSEEHFDQSVAGEEMGSGSDDEEDVEEASDEQEGDDLTVTIAATTDDDARNETSGQSTGGFAALRLNETNDTNMTEVNYEDVSDEEIDDMDSPVVIEEDDVEDLRAKAERAEELDARLDSVNSTLDELADNQETLEEVDEDKLEELREYDEPTVLTGEEHEELQSLVDEIGELFADELAEYGPFESEELQERFTPLELREKVEEHDEASIEDELGASDEDPEPEGGSASSEELEGGDEPDEDEELSEDDAREAVASELESEGLHRQAEKVREGDISLEEMGIEL